MGELESDGSVRNDGLSMALKCAADMSTTRHVLLELLKWFKSGHKELPFFAMEPFFDDSCNTIVGCIVEYMKDEQGNGKDIHRN